MKLILAHECIYVLFRQTADSHGQKIKKLSAMLLERQAIFLLKIHHIIELFGAENRSVTCKQLFHAPAHCKLSQP